MATVGGVLKLLLLPCLAAFQATGFLPPRVDSVSSRVAGKSICTLARLATESSQEVSTSNIENGRPHTAESRAKISAGNQGKVPWNKGKTHSPETKRKIAETAKLNALKRKEAKAQSLGFESSKAMEDHLAAEKAAKKLTPKVMSEATRAKISQKLKAKWRDAEYHDRMCEASRLRQRPGHTEEARKKISASLKKKWAEDGEYRAKVTNHALNSTPETRAKISASVKAKWADPEWRAKREAVEKAPMTDQHRQRISDAIKLKWEDPVYRDSASSGIRRSREAATGTRRETTKVRSRTRSPARKSPPKVAKELLTVAADGTHIRAPKPAPATATPVSKRKAPQRQEVVDKPKRNVSTKLSESPAADAPSTLKLEAAVEAAARADADMRARVRRMEAAVKADKDAAKAAKVESKKDKEAKAAELERVQRLRRSNPDLFHALYADDDEILGGKPAANPNKPDHVILRERLAESQAARMASSERSGQWK